ncbi:hypothetical protein ACIQAC_35690 [Streptomyces sp. NPDC088387]|uniref:hypothetical protein n=1 Tax=Streptomyces sp. NPDC088387 TaxID=3365859 RepID=UPI003813008C
MAWAYTLTDPDPAVPAHEVLVVCAEASGTVSWWLHTWAATPGAVAGRHLADAAARWEYDLLGDQLPWSAWENEQEMHAEPTAWLLRHAPARLSAVGASGELLHRIGLLGLTGPDRWEDPHWPGHRY